jgi:hypothetical protein
VGDTPSNPPRYCTRGQWLGLRAAPGRRTASVRAQKVAANPTGRASVRAERGLRSSPAASQPLDELMDVLKALVCEEDSCSSRWI